MVGAGEYDRAIGLYEAFLAGCYEKIEECDDSGANFSMFWADLFCGWVKARQAAGRSDAETVQQIFQWKEHDKYGFCFEIEKALAKVLSDEGYALFVAHFRKAVEKGLAGLPEPRPSAIFEYDSSIRLSGMSLKDTYRGREDVAWFCRFCSKSTA